MARKTVVKSLDFKECSDFLNIHHIQGADRSPIRIGLFHNSELVSVMTFAKSRFDQKHDYELVRSATKSGITVQGGFSKLLSNFIKTYQPKSLVTYADLRFSTGKVYEKNGFTLINESKPNYWYYRGSQILTRWQTQKHKLCTFLENFDTILSEEQNMFNNGYRQFFDAGNKVFERKF
jgi:hypothetical protein